MSKKIEELLGNMVGQMKNMQKEINALKSGNTTTSTDISNQNSLSQQKISEMMQYNIASGVDLSIIPHDGPQIATEVIKMKSANPNPDVAVTVGSGAGLSASQPICPECGLAHPPVKSGECPNAGNQVTRNQTETKGESVEIDFTNLFVQIKNSVKSQVDKKGIKDGKKFIGYIIVELMKVIENYEEN